MIDHDKKNLEDAFYSVRDQLVRLTSARLDRRLKGRVDSSDIVQDTYMVAFRRYSEYVANPQVPLVEWLRFLTLQTITEAHRFHLGRLKRTIQKEAANPSGKLSVVCVVDMLAGSLTSPPSAAIRSEMQKAVGELIDSMSATDQEIIRLRHEVMLSNDECANKLGLSSSAASKRYIRAIKRLRCVASEYL
ncbi:sigma-70 family RNA polymerase sigma factor [Neorhodopirellula pilleata]|uniref:RNA polymerase sigma factor n=1 Tax=Neorhodopirellula pilleata TaxID=2714738 RepID=A0A5C6AAA1_9BACT|nr:sigma-70 family RNA polymerase sigma factor [Neorhodopirellula pilleata]TWT96489.1 RNA polymerase sigma factor [Neorhodopirellula pilleata]